MIRLIPGDPVIQVLGPEYTPEAAEALRHKLGLDESIYTQYVKWLGNVLTGDLGASIGSGEKVTSAVKTGLGLAIVTTALALNLFGDGLRDALDVKGVGDAG